MTSNLGSDIIRDRMEKWNNKMPEKEEELLRKDIFSLLKKSMRPEFLNRVDEIVMFRPLNIEQIREIVVIQLDLVKRMLQEHNIGLKVTDDAISWIAEKGYDPQSGARPVKRLIQKEIINELSKELIAGNIPKESVVEVSVEKGKIKFKV
jgi:ATP-dependent Clp protease ATP-binding subunit ClpB